MTDTTTTTEAPFTGYFKDADSGSYGSIQAALFRCIVQPHEDEGFMFHRKHGRISYAAAIEMGLIDDVAAEAIRKHPNVRRSPQTAIVMPSANVVPSGPLGRFDGTAVGAVAAALQTFVSTRNVDDLRTFAESLEGALKAG